MAGVPSEWTVLKMLKWATAYFEDKGVTSPRMSIEWLLAEILSVKRLDLYLLYDRPLSAEELEELRPLVKKRAAHTPLQYVTESAPFFDLDLYVNSSVLIPRPETEELVDLILKEHSEDECSLWDVGTGSGCIALAIKHKKPSWDVTATDLSEEALKVAAKNADKNELDVTFYKHDLHNADSLPPIKPVDILVSNPPYILEEEKEILDEEVREYEPHLALFCESTEAMFGSIERLAKKALKKDGDLYLELHELQSENVLEIFSERGWVCEVINDYGDKPRFLKAYQKS